MSRTELRALTLTDVDAAGALLAARHHEHRVHVPWLDPAFERVDVAAREVDLLLSRAGASGALAVRDGEPVGFLVGAPRADGTWGPNVWVEGAGHAAADGEVLRDLYALAAARWVDEGLTAHYVLVPASASDLVAAWSRCGFGQQHVHALRPAAAATPAPAPADVVVRRALRTDLDALAELDLVLPTHLRRSPVFSSVAVPGLAQTRAEWAEDFDDAEQLVLVAEVDGVVAGSAVGAPVERSGAHSGLARPPGAAVLGLVSVFPDRQGRGIGRALGAAVGSWADAAGYTCVVTDWRAANLPSSRAWPPLGYADTFLRLHRLIGY